MSNSEEKDNEIKPGNEDNESSTVELKYYYSREKRLSHASPEVRAMNENSKPTKKGLLFSLLGSKSNVLLFGCVIIICFFIFVFSRMHSRNPDFTLGGNVLVLAMLYEDTVPILSIVKRAPEMGEVYLGPVDIVVRVAGSSEEEDTGFWHRVNFSPMNEQFFLISIPYTGDDFYVSFTAGNEQKSIRLR